MDRINELKKEAKRYFTHASHGFDHVERVCKLAVTIAEKENLSSEDVELVEAVALLHDIARTGELNGNDEDHAKKGAEMCIPILKKFGYNESQIKIISDAIKTHRYRNQLKPASKIGEIIQDADRLDLLGAIGIARIFTRTGEIGRPMHNPLIKPDENYKSNLSTGINHFYEKVFKINPDSFHTKTAKEIAKARYNYTKEFVERFLKEWDGKE